jgi:hypothetical protein
LNIEHQSPPLQSDSPITHDSPLPHTHQNEQERPGFEFNLLQHPKSHQCAVTHTNSLPRYSYLPFLWDPSPVTAELTTRRSLDRRRHHHHQPTPSITVVSACGRLARACPGFSAGIGKSKQWYDNWAPWRRLLPVAH